MASASRCCPTRCAACDCNRTRPAASPRLAGVACDTNNDLLLLDGLTRLRSLLDEAGQPTRVCMWSQDSYIQSLDITGWSTTELNLHRSKLVDVSATIEMASSARRLLAHLQTDMIRHRRVERFVRQAGFDLESIEPTPIAIARLVPSYTMRLIGSRGDAQPWMAVVHDHLVLAAAPDHGGQVRDSAHRTSGHQLVGVDRGSARATARPGQSLGDGQPACRHRRLTRFEPGRRRLSGVSRHPSGVGSTPGRRAWARRSPRQASPDGSTNCSHSSPPMRSATTAAFG